MNDDAVARRALFTRLPQGLFVILLVAAFALEFGLAWPLPDFPYRWTSGLVVVLVGIGLAAWAAWTMRRHDTSPMPWEPVAALVVRGPYRVSRNPIYLGDVLVMTGLGLMFGTTWALLAAVAAMPLATWTVIRHEEAYLAARFGESWAAYRARVRRWL